MRKEIAAYFGLNRKRSPRRWATKLPRFCPKGKRGGFERSEKPPTRIELVTSCLMGPTSEEDVRPRFPRPSFCLPAKRGAFSPKRKVRRFFRRTHLEAKKGFYHARALPLSYRGIDKLLTGNLSNCRARCRSTGSQKAPAFCGITSSFCSEDVF